jgi:serine protease Do
MLAANDFDGKRRTGFLPYLYGGITGISLGLLIVAAVLIMRGPEGNGTPRIALADDPPYRAASLDTSRRNAIVRATELVAPAVVSIDASYTRQTRPVYDWFWRRYYPGRKRTFSNQGSGVIIDKSGYIFTNYHVIQRAERISVNTYNGERYEAELVYPAPAYDLALLKIPGNNFHAAPLGNSDDLLVGEWAIAIGSPFGRYLVDTQPTVTVGVISANHRDIKQEQESEQIFNDMIQTDAAINPGNSGGPLVNSNGELIGINTVIFSGGTGANIGMGFAIPVNRAVHMFREIKEHGRLRDVWLGMTATDITADLALGLELPTDKGVLIRTIEDDAPADKAGLKPGDQLLAIDGVQVQNRDHANRIIFGSRVGDELEMTVNRRDEIETFTIKLEERPTDI